MKTKAIILAAGFGSRLMPLTENLPKAMVKISGKSLVEYQLEAMAACGVSDITLVGGYRADILAKLPHELVINEHYETTNMVSSLFCAESLFNGESDLIVSYGDIVYNAETLESLLATSGDIVVASDKCWRDLWSLRMEDPLSDAETFLCGEGGKLIELGRRPESLDQVQGQYIGLVKYSRRVQERVAQFYRNMSKEKTYDGKSFDQMFMTSFLQALIDSNFDVRVSWIEGGWLEVDTLKDLDVYMSRIASGDGMGIFP